MKLMRFATPLLVLLSACAVQAAPLVSIGDYSVPTGQSLQVSIQVSSSGIEISGSSATFGLRP